VYAERNIPSPPVTAHQTGLHKRHSQHQPLSKRNEGGKKGNYNREEKMKYKVRT